MRFAVGALGEGMDTSRMPWPLATMTRPDAAMFNAGILSHRDQLDPVQMRSRQDAPAGDHRSRLLLLSRVGLEQSQRSFPSVSPSSASPTSPWATQRWTPLRRWEAPPEVASSLSRAARSTPRTPRLP